MRKLLMIPALLLASHVSADHQLNSVNFSPVQIDCLARNIYFESRSESLEGQYAVAHVTMNRVKSHKYPNNICDVVKQHRQFSWYTGPGSVVINWKDPIEVASWRSVMNTAIDFMHNYANGMLPDPTNGSMWYHTTSIEKPNWAYKLKQTMIIGEHVFYRK